MKRLLCCLLCLSSASLAHAASFCVQTAGAMQAALDAAAASPEADIINVRSSGLVAPAQGFSYLPNNTPSNDLTIRGGYDPFCLTRSPGAKAIVDATGVTANQALRIQAQAATISISHMTFVNMPDNGDLEANAAVSINDLQGDVQIEASAFLLNDGIAGSALRVYAPGGMVRLLDNIFADNHTRQWAVSIEGFPLPAGAVECEITNNTVTRNTSNDDGGLGLIYCNPAEVRNNVLWGNSGYDLGLEGDADNSSYLLAYNDIHHFSIGPATPVTQADTTDADPLFVGGAYVYYPPPGSPLIDAGDPSTQIANNPFDYYENPRIQGGVIDLGAVEKKLAVFANGFE